MHLVIGTPMYGGMCCSEYVQSLMALKDAMQQHGHTVTCVFLGNESLIQRGRNTIAWHFLNMDASHLLFVDADQSFRPADVAKMLKADKPILGGAVPMKGINWGRVKQGAVLNHPDLSKLTGIFNVNKLPGHEMVRADEPFEVKHVGTGFMLIRRDVFDDLKEHVGYYTNGGTTIPDGDKVYDFFKVQNINGELLSEDYNFCNMYRERDGKVWVAPWCELGHFGAYHFSGQYAAGAS
jgi:hypothetical protein